MTIWEYLENDCGIVFNGYWNCFLWIIFIDCEKNPIDSTDAKTEL